MSLSDAQKKANYERAKDIKEARTPGTAAFNNVQQPIDAKTGYTNPLYNRLYGAKNNPHMGTERDHTKRKTTYFT